MSKIVFKKITTFILIINLFILSCSSSDDLQNNNLDSVIMLEFGTSLVFQDSGKLNEQKDAIKTVVKETVSLVNKKMDVENLKIRINVSLSNVIPEIGIGGFNPSEQEITISIDPNFTNLEQSISIELAPMIVHEMHHAKRRRTIGYGSTLLEASVSEGLADCFAMEIKGIEPPLWSIALTGSELDGWIVTAQDSWRDGSYDHGKWFFGTSSDVPRWTGYSIGFKLVKDYITENPTKKPSELFNESANSFVK